MKITKKLPLVQVILTVIFVIAIFLISYFHHHSGRLKMIQVDIQYLNEDVNLLKEDMELLPIKNRDYYDQYQDLINRETSISTQLESLSELLTIYERLYPQLLASFRINETNWNNLLGGFEDTPNTSLSMLQKSLSDLGYIGILYTYTDDVLGLRESLHVLDKGQYADIIEMIENTLTLNEDLLKILNSTVIESLNQFSEQTTELTESLLRQMRIWSFLIAMLLFGTGILIGLFLASNISRNLTILDKSIGQVASGNIHFSLTMEGKDEFREIGDNFNNLTNTLWFRLDSLKDLMRDLGSSVEDNTDQQTLLETVLELSIDSTTAESGIIMLYNEESNHLQLAAMLGDFPPPVKVPGSVMMNENYLKEWFQRYQMKMGETLIGESAQRKTYFFVKDNMQQGLFPNNRKPESSLFISSAIILPLMNQDTILGVLVLSKNTPNSLFTELDYTFMKSYARFVTITLDNFTKYQEVVHKHELNKEIDVAAEIQKTLLPGRMPRMKTLQIGAYSDAAKGVSGDYYDVFPLDKNKMAIIICDVSGKGIPASLFMVMIRTVIRTVSSPSMNAAQILKLVNQQITGNFRTGTFATISLLVVDQKNYQISYANGAHHPLYLYRASTGKYLKFDADGLPLGIDIHATFGHKKIHIEPKDYLLLFTDGLPEARNALGEELSTNRLLHQALNYVEKGPGQMKDGIRSYLKRFCKNTKQHDDETFVAVKIT